MAKDKKGFVLYSDQIILFDELTDEQAGKLIKHIYRYVNDENPKTDNQIINISFAPIKAQLKRDLKKYEARCKKNKENIEKRWNKKNTNEYERKQTNTKNTDKDNDKDNDKDKYNKDFMFFWDSYHKITGKQKTDKKPAYKKWLRLHKSDKETAILNIKPYFDSLNDKKYCKKARTYLEDENFNDEFDIKIIPEDDATYKDMEKPFNPNEL
jgi:hypothetical protein